jgi:hypothetical protein
VTSVESKVEIHQKTCYYLSPVSSEYLLVERHNYAIVVPNTSSIKQEVAPNITEESPSTDQQSNMAFGQASASASG